MSHHGAPPHPSTLGLDPTRGDERLVHFVKGRGAGSNGASRFEAWQRVREPSDEEAWSRRDAEGPKSQDASEGQDGLGSPVKAPATQVQLVSARSIISRNDSPDIPFSQSVNPYQGCEHGCIYCYARPSHAYLGLSPGLDFERLIFAKRNAAALLREALNRPGYQPSAMAVGANTDPYQPAERGLRITRSVLEVLAEARLPFTLITKSALVLRDVDLLAPLARQGLVQVCISLPTVDPALARVLEPRAPAPARRLQAMKGLAEAGVPVSVFAAPVIPALTDRHLEQVLKAAHAAGASSASWVLLRLPLEVRELFTQWLQQHFPDRARHVMSLVEQMRQGPEAASAFGVRMKGAGVHAELIGQRFRTAAARLGLTLRSSSMSVAQFRPPSLNGQLTLF